MSNKPFTLTARITGMRDSYLQGYGNGNDTYKVLHDAADRIEQLTAQRDALLLACEAVVEGTGGSKHWKGITHHFLSLCEAAIAKATEAQT